MSLTEAMRSAEVTEDVQENVEPVQKEHLTPVKEAPVDQMSMAPPPPAAAAVPHPALSAAKSQEREQEVLLKKKYPGFKPGGGSVLLHKRLNKEPKYFDSGDYNMAKAKLRQKAPAHPGSLPQTDPTLLTESTGEKIPTPENVPPRKTVPGGLQSKLASMQ